MDTHDLSTCLLFHTEEILDGCNNIIVWLPEKSVPYMTVEKIGTDAYR